MRLSMRLGAGLLDRALSPRGANVVLAALAAILVGQGLNSGAHDNLFFLAFLFSSLVAALIVTASGRAKLVVAAVFVFFLYYNPVLAPARLRPIENLDLLPGQSRLYRFDMRAFAERKVDCGDFSGADIFVQGNGLQPGLRGDPVPVVDQVVEPFHGIQMLQGHVALSPAHAQTLNVTLANSGQQTVTLSRGVELSGARFYFDAAGLRPYFDAVYMIADNDKCRLVLHPESEQP